MHRMRAEHLHDFNPRLREGGDRIRAGLTYPELNFNPRLREGGDFAYIAAADNDKISIHASAREATVNGVKVNLSYEFQSTPPRGRRR